MKNVLLTSLSLFLALSVLAQEPVKKYAFGDSIFVWASSLNMRESPNPNAKIVGKAPYGSAVVVVDDEIGKLAYKYKAVEAWTSEYGVEHDAFYLNGFWVKVNFDGTVGYVFDGYLSKLKTFPAFKEDHGYDLHGWAANTHHLKLYKKWKVGDYNVSRAYMEEYGKPSSKIRVLLGCEKCGCSEIRLKNVSLEEGRMLGLQIFGKDSSACSTEVFFEKGYLVIYQLCCC